MQKAIRAVLLTNIEFANFAFVGLVATLVITSLVPHNTHAQTSLS